MPKEEGTAHGRHYTEEERVEDENRNHNQSHGRGHFAEDEHEKAGGHSDRWANDSTGEQHEFSSGKDDDNLDVHNKPQDEGQMQGEARNEGGHQGGRNKKNSR
ncbi:MAG: hypothetical protein ABJA50_11785 [Chloroflexota bacterium]